MAQYGSAHWTNQRVCFEYPLSTLSDLGNLCDALIYVQRLPFCTLAAIVDEIVNLTCVLAR